ncbi:MAG: hypothetical protein MPJ24_01915, partial [Pirellulaceae bacterium]|nr:hypothetical protein [Pirellulaceae bacterium]
VLMFGSINYHVVRAEDGFHLIPKMAAKFEDAYVDIREFDVENWQKHPSLVAAIIKADKKDLLNDSVSETLKSSVSGFLDQFKEPS